MAGRQQGTSSAGNREYKPEVSDTLDSVELQERLEYDLNITEREYKSDHDIDAELTLRFEPTKKALRTRRTSVSTPLAMVGELLDRELELEGYPGTNVHVGISTRNRSDEETEYVGPTVDGLPENSTLTVEGDWTEQELEEAQAEGEMKVETRAYDISGFPTDDLPIIVRAKLYRDAVELLNKRDTERSAQERGEKTERERTKQERKNRRARFEGQAALTIALEHREDVSDRDQTLYLKEFEVDMSQTFPDIEFLPEHGSTYNPERKRVVWKGGRTTPGAIERYTIIGPIDQLLDLDHISAEVTGHISNTTLSGRSIAGVFDESGKRIGQYTDVTHEVDLDCSIEIDPDALSGQVQKKTDATFNVIGLPEEVYTELEDLCRREGIHIRDQSRPADAEPAQDREGVWVVKGKTDRGELEVKREYGNRGVVYATIIVTGEYTPSSKEQHVSASEGASDKLVRADSGSLDRRGRTTIEIDARSSSSELNSEFIGTFEEAFPGGEAK